MNNFDPGKYFRDEPVSAGGSGHVAGGIGAWILHIAKVTFLLYSGAHAINATLNYAGSSDWAKAAQIVGIVTLEAVLFGVYLAWHNGRITGAMQSITAGATYAVGFILACLGIVADSQLNAAAGLRPWLLWYLHWGLPVAPAVMALGAILVSELAPDRLRQRTQARERADLEDEKFKALIANQRAELKEAQALRGIQLAGREAVLQELYRTYTGPDVQRAIASTASNNVPALLRAAGIHIEDVADVNNNGQLDLDDVAAHLAQTEQWRVAFFNRHGGPEYVEPLGSEQDAISLASNLCRSDPVQGDYLVERYDPAAKLWVTMHVVRWGETAAAPEDSAPFRRPGTANGVVRPGTGTGAAD